jgi:hypothetical protein
MKPTKYPHGNKTARDFVSAVKRAPANELFFSRDTMRFFGRQSFSVYEDNGRFVFVIRFLEKCPRITEYLIDPETLKLTPKPRDCE